MSYSLSEGLANKPCKASAAITCDSEYRPFSVEEGGASFNEFAWRGNKFSQRSRIEINELSSADNFSFWSVLMDEQVVKNFRFSIAFTTASSTSAMALFSPDRRLFVPGAIKWSSWSASVWFCSANFPKSFAQDSNSFNIRQIPKLSHVACDKASSAVSRCTFKMGKTARNSEPLLFFDDDSWFAPSINLRWALHVWDLFNAQYTTESNASSSEDNCQHHIMNMNAPL